MALEAPSHKGKPPALLAWRSSETLIVTTASFAVFTDIFLYGVIVPVLPFSLPSRVGIAEDQVQYWVSISLAVYAAALLASSPAWGFMADRLRNRRIPMLVGLVALTGATLCLCLSTSIGVLLLGRALQGLSGALTWTVGLALVIDTVDSSNIGKATGWIGMATSLGVFVAPLLGGVVYDRGGYYPVFAMCFALLAVDIVLRLAIIEVKEARLWRDAEDATNRLNAGGHTEAGLECHGSTPVSDKEQLPTPEVDSRESHVVAERPPNLAFSAIIKLLRKPRLLAALWGTLVFAILQTAFDSTLPLLVADLFGWGSLGAGLVFLPIILPSFLSPLVGAIGDRYGSKWLATGGFFVCTPFLICLRFVTQNSIDHKVLLCAMLAGAGIAVACIFGPLMAEITWAVLADDAPPDGEVRDEDQDQPREPPRAEPIALVYGVYNMAYSGGALLGPIMGGMIRDTAGWGTLTWVLGLLSFVTCITQLIWVGKPIRFNSKLFRS